MAKYVIDGGKIKKSKKQSSASQWQSTVPGGYNTQQWIKTLNKKVKKLGFTEYLVELPDGAYVVCKQSGGRWMFRQAKASEQNTFRPNQIIYMSSMTSIA